MDELVGEVLVHWLQAALICGLAWGGWLAFRSRHWGRKDRAAGDDALLRTLTVAVLMVVPFLVEAGDPMAQARADYDGGRYAQALTRFEAMAQGGNGEAQEISGFMYLHGPGLYGAAVPFDRARASYWFERAAENNRDVARHMLCVLNGRPERTVTARQHCAVKEIVQRTPTSAVGR